MTSERRSAYGPTINRLSMLLEFVAQIALSAGVAGYLCGWLFFESGSVMATTFVGVGILWIAACFRTRVTITDDSLLITNRWRQRIIPRSLVHSFETRGASRGFFDAGGRTMPVATILLKDDAGAVAIDVSVSTSRNQRQRLVDLLQQHRFDVKGLSHYVAGKLP